MLNGFKFMENWNAKPLTDKALELLQNYKTWKIRYLPKKRTTLAHNIAYYAKNSATIGYISLPKFLFMYFSS